MLGGLSVVQGDRRISRFQTQKTGALLAYLALNHAKSHSRESLAEMLWPEGDPTAIRNRLNQAISSLRRQLHPPELGPGSVLVTDHHSVGINSQVVVSDVEEFERDIRLAERAKEPSERLQHYEAAVNRYKGELLEGYFEEWVFAKRMQLADQIDQALQHLIRGHVEAGNSDRAIEFARTRLQMDPYDEGPHVTLMRLYLRAGRPKSALKQFEDLERALKQFDDEPSEYALKFRNRAENLQSESISTEDDDEDLPVLAPVRAIEPQAVREEPSTYLPRVVSSFIGREAELKQIVDLLLENRSRLVSILGMGGCGKTRLGIEAGWQVVEAFQGKVFFIPLAGVEEIADVPSEIARVVIPDHSGQDDPLNAAITHLKTLPKSLLILDNFEHLADDGAFLVKDLLGGAPTLSILVTTRVPLNLEGETHLLLAPLPLPRSDEDSTLRDLAANPAVALFIERAQAVKADFQLTERTWEAIVDLCRKLEGLPLALELAAGWARVMTPGQMLDQFRANIDQLASRRKDINPRHRSLRAAFDGSYSLLDAHLKDVFLRLTFFSGGWDFDSAQHLCPGQNVIDAIHALEERSMVFSEPTDHHVRFGMLETIRAFGDNLVTPDLLAECGWLHAECFLDLAERPLPDNQWVPQVKADYQNFVAALRWLQESEHQSEFARLAVALSRYWEGPGLLADGREWLDAALDQSDSLDPLLAAQVKATSGHLDWLAGDFDLAKSRVSEAREIFHHLGAERQEMEAIFQLQQEAHRRGDYEESKRLLDAKLQLAESLQDERAKARCYLAMGNTLIEQEDWESAQAQYEKSLESGRKIRDADRIGAALANLASLAIYRGHLDAARKWLDEAVEQIRPSDLRWRPAMTLIVQGRLENAAGRHAQAATILAKAYRMAHDEKLVVWRFLLNYGFALAGLGHLNESIRTLGYFERYRERIGETHLGIEMRTYEAQLDELRRQVDPDRFAEEFQIGRNMGAEEIDRLIVRTERMSLSF